jgi:arylsulfatase A-like enzyme
MMVPEADTLDEPSRKEMEACGGTFASQQTGRCSGEALLRAMSNSMDTLIGKLLDEVDRLDRNTIVVFIGDNGTPMYGRPNLDFIDNFYISRTGRGKGTTYESGARVPLVVRGPGIGRGEVSDEFTHAADLFPTIISLAGLKPPTMVSNGDGSGTLAVDGVSLAPIVTGKAKTVRDPDQDFMLTESMNLMTNNSRQIGARNGNYKVICNEKAEIAACEFYNLADDPLEEYPLAKPANCSGNWTTKDPQWHYCRLEDKIRTESFFAKGR